ncbi:IQ domain-containing protein IQM3-like isoform X1 [Populus nigra]|uniref:IQ domain-containing protein IQM3-like isoform X1 n=1 Tax=Populus nigra TaxID=3691 RepID=UPI002B2705AF|nr:IQ domain-containing protein IQM3-like isoform X1 [Populus nigra]
MALSVDRYRSGMTEKDRSERSKRFESAAAVKLQKVYRSYRTRRRLADSAVVAEELWWRALDYARLNHSTVSFFSFDKPETAASRWSRISLNASKVGKGLGKDAKAQKLAFQHWIEAIDPRHRYGHNLNLYHEEWSKTDALQPFFYWLDIGDGKEIDLKDCPRTRLCLECIQYLGPQERELYEYIIAEGTVVHKQNGNLLDTNQGLEGSKWIFVMSTCRKLYAGEKKKGAFHHSSFLAGGTTLAAGRLTAENGKLRSISAYSGHYRPTNQKLGGFLAFLEENGINLNEIRVLTPEDSESCESRELSQDRSKFGWSMDSKPSKLHASSKINNYQPSESSMSSQATRTCSYKRMLSANIQNTKANVPKKEILQRIKSKNEASSYQLGHQLSLKWSTGAGPRIGCVADYPLKLREQALTFVYLSSSDDLRKPSASELPGCLLSIIDLCRMM